MLMPMTLPPMSRSGPPLLPGLIAASVWMRPVSVAGRPVASSLTVTVRSTADTMPFVTVSVKVPSGLPMAIAVSSDLELRRFTDAGRGQPGGLDLDERQVFVVFESIRVAGYWLPSSSSTVSEELSATTWALVRM